MNNILMNFSITDIGGNGDSLSTSYVSGLDICVTVLYIVGIVALGCWVGLRKHKGGKARDYFLAGGNLRWPIIGLALFATNISCVHMVSLAQSGYDTGLLNGNFEWMAAFTLVMLGLFFAPFYIRSRVPTLPDFLERRYNRECRDWLAVLSLLSAIIIHIGFSFLTGGIVLNAMFGIDMYLSIVIIASLTGLYTIIGGLMAVVVTEAIQTVVLIIGAILITAYAWNKMGGWESMTAVLETKNALGENNINKLSMLRPHGDASGMPWYSIFLGYPVLGIWYWCADQTIVQRVLGARNENHARIGPIFAGLIKILPVFIFVLPGLLAFTLAQSGRLDLSSLNKDGERNIRVLIESKALTLQNDQLLIESGLYDHGSHILKVDEALGRKLISEPMASMIREEGDSVIESKGIYGVMITQLLPKGLIGVMVAALLAALMSTVSGALNSISTLFSFDLYKRFKPDASDKQLVWIGRVTASCALLMAICLVPLLNGYPSIFNGLNDIIAHMAPPVTCVFLLGVFWKRASAKSAKLTLWLGSALGAVVYLLCKLGDKTPFAAILNDLSGSSFMMMAFYLLCACILMQVTFSLIWPSGEKELNSKLYWKHPLEPLKDKGWPLLGNYKLLSFLLLATISILYYFFR